MVYSSSRPYVFLFPLKPNARGSPRAFGWASPCARLLDHLVRLEQERRRDREAQGLGGLQVDDEFELHRPLHRQVPGLGVWYLTRYADCLAVLRDRRAGNDTRKSEVYRQLTGSGAESVLGQGQRPSLKP